MMKRLLYILSLLCFCLLTRAEVRTDIPCGEWLTIEAHPFSDYVFVKWSDGNTDSVRSIQVNEDATYIAYFAAKCEEYANWPVVALYDWLMMLNVRAINQMGYYFSKENVTWYRVVGEPDDMHANFPQDDQLICRDSYYLTLDKNLQGTGSYYAVVDVSNAQGLLCDGLMRSVIVNYSGSSRAPQVALLPTYTRPGQQLKLIGIAPDETTTIQIYSPAGQLISMYSCQDTQYFFPAECVAGCYYVRVSSPSVSQVLKYIVQN